MRTDEPDLSRLLAGEQPEEEKLRDVAVFLGALRAAYPPAPVEAFREQHLAAVSREVRLVAAAPRSRPVRGRRARRTIVAAIAAALGLLGVGAGVATAMGGNPLMILPGLRLGPPETPRSAVPTPVPSGPTPTTTAPGERRPSVLPTRAPSRTSPPGKSGEGHGRPATKPGNNGKSSQAQASHKPTALPTQANGRATPPAKRRGSVPPEPASTGSEDQVDG